MQENQNLFSLTIDPVTKNYLTEIYRWTKFLAITGMVVLVLGLVAVLLGATIRTDFSIVKSMVDGSEVAEVTPAARVSMAIASVVIVAVAFFPLYYLLQFANMMKKALASNNQEALNLAFGKLKIYFKYLGIVFIILFAFYALAILVAILGNTRG